MMKYEGKRIDGVVVVWRVEDSYRVKLPVRLDLRNHSPTGFEWGYGGSGPAQLALALLADFLCDDEKALLLYQDFKWECIARIQDPEWEITAPQLREVVARLEIKHLPRYARDE